MGTLRNHVYNKNPQVANLYSLVKLHKPGHRIKPVVRCVTKSSTELCSLLIIQINNYCKCSPKVSIKNSYELIYNIQNINKRHNVKLLLWDVVTFFRDVPPKEAFTLTDQSLKTLTQSHTFENYIFIIIK